MKLKIIMLQGSLLSCLMVSSGTWATDVMFYGPGEVPSVNDVARILGGAGPSNVSLPPKKGGLGKRKGYCDEDCGSGMSGSTGPEVVLQANVSELGKDAATPVVTSASTKPVRDMAMQIVFALNSYAIDTLSNAGLDMIAEGIKPYQTTILIEGHTDASGSPEQNLHLSIKRAEAVKDYLVQKGVRKNRMVTRGLASTRLLNKSNPYAASNRRVQFSLVN